MTKKDLTKYIGEKEIKSISDDNIVEFADGTKQYYSDVELAYMVTDEKTDDTQLLEMLCDKIVPEIMDVIEKYNVKKAHIQRIVQGVVGSYNHTFNLAMGKAFGTYEEGKHPSSYPDNIRVSDIKKIKES